MLGRLAFVLSLTAGSASAATIADQVYPQVAIKVDAATLTCSPGNAAGDFPIAGEVQLQVPRLNDYTELDHYPTLSLLSTLEDCAFMPALLTSAADQQGFLSADLRVILTEERLESDDSACRIDLVETASIKLAGRSLVSERRVSRPCN